MLKQKNRVKEIISYLFILSLTILFNSLTTKAAILDWFISDEYVTKIVVVVIFVVVGLVIIVFIIAKYNVISKLGTAVKKIKL